MKGRGLSAVGAVVLFVAVACPALVWGHGGSEESAEETTITSYDADFVVDGDGDMTVTERLTVDFPAYGKHGIFRFFDLADPNAPSTRRKPHDIKVERDGQQEEWERLTEGRGRYVVARIGSEYRTLQPGAHTYVLRYQIDDVLLADDAGSRFYWNLVPGGWAQSITEARLRVTLPGQTRGVRCAVGSGSVSGCGAAGEGTEELTVEASGLPPRTPVTIAAYVGVPTPPVAEEHLWSARLDPVLSGSVWGMVAALLAAAAAAALGLRVAAGTREKEPAFPVQYAPPPGVTPAQGDFLLTERTRRRQFMSSVLYAAEQGVIDVTRVSETGGWHLTDRGDDASWRALGPVAGSIADPLCLRGQTFWARPENLEDGEKLQAAQQLHESTVKSWARSEGYLRSSWHGAIAIVTVVSAVLALLVVVWGRLPSLWALVPGAYAVASVPCVLPESWTQRTPSSRDLWSRLGGFRRMLATPSSQQRFDFAGRHDLYTAYVPWAVAFGVTREWALKYRTETGLAPPAPVWFAGGDGYHLDGVVDSMVDDFSSVVGSAISSYESSQSSSGGGGGFSGGGGGGGGGGGSW